MGPSGIPPCSRAINNFLLEMKLLAGQIAGSSLKASVAPVVRSLTTSAKETRLAPWEEALVALLPAGAAATAGRPPADAGTLLARPTALALALALALGEAPGGAWAGGALDWAWGAGKRSLTA